MVGWGTKILHAVQHSQIKNNNNNKMKKLKKIEMVHVNLFTKQK